MLTPEGRELLWEIAVSQRGDYFAAFMRVSDGNGQQAQAPIDDPVIDGDQMTCVATFERDVANFEWRKYEIVSAEGVIVCSVEEDLGRKVNGTITILKIKLGLRSGDDVKPALVGDLINGTYSNIADVRNG